MAIELNINKVATAAAGDAKLSEDLGAAQGAKLGAVLGGENVKVTSGAMTDLEKLVAQLKNENENTKMSVSQRRISILQTVLDSMAGHISDTQRANILEIESLNMGKAELEGDLKRYNAEKTSTEGRIAVLAEQIKALENQIEQAVEDGAAHRELVAKLKEERAREFAELDRIESAITSATSKIAGIDRKISTCTAAIGAVTLNEVTAVLRMAAGEVDTEVERPESEAERKKAEEKAAATDIAKHISEALDKIDDQIRKTLDEAQELVKA